MAESTRQPELLPEDPEDRHHFVLYEFHATEEAHRNDRVREAVSDFLKAHGVTRMPLSAVIRIRVHSDASLWLHARQAPEGWPLCENCENCLKSDAVKTPLVAAPPAVPGASFRESILTARGWAPIAVEGVRSDG